MRFPPDRAGLPRRHVIVSALALAFAGSIAISATRAAFAAETAPSYVQTMGERALALLTADTSQAERVEGMSALFREGLDLKIIARFALGQHWQTATPAQRAEYEETFGRVMIGQYARLWSQERAKSFRITGAQVLGERDTLVSTEVVRENKPPLRFGWRVRRGDDGFRIVDLMVDGISMLITQRDDFNAAVRQRGVDGLIAQLRQREAQL